jgi:hypothetical protein
MSIINLCMMCCELSFLLPVASAAWSPLRCHLIQTQTEGGTQLGEGEVDTLPSNGFLHKYSSMLIDWCIYMTCIVSIIYCMYLSAYIYWYTLWLLCTGPTPPGAASIGNPMHTEIIQFTYHIMYRIQ